MGAPSGGVRDRDHRAPALLRRWTAVAIPTTTWPTDLEAAWHLSAGLDSDSTINGHGLSGGASVGVVPGIVGDARGFAGQDSLTAGDPPDGSLDFGSSSFSISTWVRVASSIGEYDMPVFKGGSASVVPGYSLQLGTIGWYANFSDGILDQGIRFGNEIDLIGGWVHLVAVVDRSVPELRSYTNGAFVEAAPIIIGSVDTDDELELGGPNPYRFAGSVDETRIYRRALSADWIRAEY